MAYLCTARGLDPDIVRGLMKYGKIYETVQWRDQETRRYVDSPYHNAVFVAYGLCRERTFRQSVKLTLIGREHIVYTLFFPLNSTKHKAHFPADIYRKPAV
jgi:hypothetical protein